MQIMNERKVETHGNDVSMGNNVLGHRRRHRTVAAPDFQHASLAADSE
jgi:hypothetical protein